MFFSLISFFFAPFSIFDITNNYVIPQAVPHVTRDQALLLLFLFFASLLLSLEREKITPDTFI